jgi:lysophospholipase L1-like esterase
MSQIVLVFGDSIVMGLWDERGGWPERLWNGHRMNSGHRVDLAKYIRNMEDMIDRAREGFTRRIICVGLAPIDQSKSVQFLLERTISFFSADQREYDSALETVCRRKRVRHVSLRDLKFENHLLEDGVHPLSSGHAMIADRVLEAIDQLDK